MPPKKAAKSKAIKANVTKKTQAKASTAKAPKKTAPAPKKAPAKKKRLTGRVSIQRSLEQPENIKDSEWTWKSLADSVLGYFKKLPIPVAGLPMSTEERIRLYGVGKGGIPLLSPGEYRGEEGVQPVPGSYEAVVRWIWNVIQTGQIDLEGLTDLGLSSLVMNQAYEYLRKHTDIGKLLLGQFAYGDQVPPTTGYDPNTSPETALARAFGNGAPSPNVQNYRPDTPYPVPSPSSGFMPDPQMHQMPQNQPQPPFSWHPTLGNVPATTATNYPNQPFQGTPSLPPAADTEPQMSQADFLASLQRLGQTYDAQGQGRTGVW